MALRRFLMWWPDGGEKEETAEQFEVTASPLTVAPAFLLQRIPLGLKAYMHRSGATLAVRDLDSGELREIELREIVVQSWSCKWKEPEGG